MGKIRTTPRGTLHLARIQVRLHLEAISISRNDALIEWVNHQPLASPITCLGMGMTEFGTNEIAPNGERREILDWSLNGEFAQGGGSLKRLRQAETLLWRVVRQRLCLLIAPLNKLRILSTTSTSTVTASSTTSTTRQNRFVRLALGR